MQKQQEFLGNASALRIRSLSDPTRKMSKSVNDPKGTILLSDDPDEAAKKVMSATTDSLGKFSIDYQTQPGITNLLQVFSLIAFKYT